MNRTHELFDDRIAEWLENDPLEAPPQVLQTVLAAMPSVPQRRVGLAWLPAALPRAWQLAAAVVLVLAVSIFAVQALNPPTVAPSQSPQTTPVPSAPGPSARPTPTVVPPTASPVAGAPLPAELIGAWHHPAPRWWWFLRAGDPECVQALRTQLDCAVWQRGTTPREIGIATMSGRNLKVAWKTGFCTGISSTYSVALDGDSLTLVDIGGGCEGGTFALTRAGTGSAPTAPPPPTP
jgi:hypothetical protein